MTSPPALPEPEPWLDALATICVRAAARVHGELGPGLLESVYEECLALELLQMGRRVDRQVVVPVVYRGIPVAAHLRLDMIVDDALIIEVKSIDHILPVHRAQLTSYMRLRGARLGLLINFNVPRISQGVRRIINSRHPGRGGAPGAVADVALESGEATRQKGS